jgi:hypothetical protein
MQSAPQFTVLREPNFGFAIGPVLVAHEAQNGQHLRLREQVLAETTAIARHGGFGDIQRHLCESHQTHFGHGQQRVSPELFKA